MAGAIYYAVAEWQAYQRKNAKASASYQLEQKQLLPMRISKAARDVYNQQRRPKECERMRRVRAAAKAELSLTAGQRAVMAVDQQIATDLGSCEQNGRCAEQT